MTSLQRNITNVINRIKDCIDPDFSEFKELNEELDYLISSSLYKAPELMYELWNNLGYILGKFLYVENEPEWMKKIGRIIRAEE